MEWDPVQSTCGLNIFLSYVGDDNKYQLLVRHPNIIDITQGSKTITSSLASKMSRNMRIFAETYGKDNHYLYKEASFSTLTPYNIIETVN